MSLKRVVTRMGRAYLKGDWKRAGIALKNLSTRITPLAQAQLYEDGELVLKRMVGHIDAQDLGWTPLSEDTIRQKDGSDTIYVETRWLRDNLSVRRVKGGTVFVGASPWKTHKPSGRKFSELMMFQEYGTSTQPPRPLVRPTWEEVEPIIKDNWRGLVKRMVD